MFRAIDQWKYLGSWFSSQRKDYILDHAIPWLTFDAINFLKKNLSRNLRVFEYGSGGSTLFWLKYDAICVSIEHDPEWHAMVKARLKSTDRVELRLVGADPSAPSLERPDISDPESYLTDWPAYASQTFHNYVCQIDSFADGYFDVVLVDGHARPSCIAHSYKKVKSGGLLIVDNAELPQYQAALHEYLVAFKCHSFTAIAPVEGVLSRTNVYIAP